MSSRQFTILMLDSIIHCATTIVVRDFGFFLPSGFLSVLTNIIFSNSDFLSGIAK